MRLAALSPTLLSHPAAPTTRDSSGVLTGPPIFISGCNRGGTTILSQLLATHPEVRNIGRGEFNEGQYIWRKRYPDWSRHRWALPPWRWFLRRDARSATPAVLRGFREAFASAMPSPGRMLEKTPANALRIPLIDRIFPNCHFVHVLRDGRHTTASLIARRVWPVLAPHQWVQAHTIALADLTELSADRFTLVRYEELREDPEAVLRELCRRCDLSWKPAPRTPVLHAARTMLQAPAARWDGLPLRTRKGIIRVIGNLQREFDYPVDL